MNPWFEVIVAIAAVVGGGGGVFAFISSLRNSAIESRKADQQTVKDTADTENAAFDRNMELSKYIREQVAEAVTPVEKRVREAAEREEKRTRAFSHILRDIAAQWPPGAVGPKLNPVDIAAVEDTLPSAWLAAS